MKRVHLSFAILSLFILFSAGGISIHAQVVGKLLTVTNNGDSADANAGDGICADAGGQCTLRAAIQESNTTQRNVIIFAMPWPAAINLTLGELAITGNFTSIVGPGARRLSIQRSSAQGTPNFRIFHIPNAQTNIVIRGLSIKNGDAIPGETGGGLRIAADSTLNLTDVAITGNDALSGGGVSNEGRLNAARSLFNSNTAAGFSGQGAAILNSPGSSARLTNSTITGNSAINGGGIYNSGTLLLVNNTIAQNAATVAAGNIFSNPSGTVSILNTIVASNGSSSTSIAGAFISLGHNIVTDIRNSTGFVNGVNNDQASSTNSIDPLLGNLADNGGQTDTGALLTGSPAIDTGSDCIRNNDCPTNPPINLSTDQRANYIRLFAKAVDIGSFEAEAGPLNTNGGVLSFSNLGDGAFYGGSIAVLINVVTNERLYSPIRPFGNFGFRNVFNEVHVLEIKSKRARLATGPRIFSFSDRNVVPFLTDEIQPDGNLVMTYEEPAVRPK